MQTGHVLDYLLIGFALIYFVIFSRTIIKYILKSTPGELDKKKDLNFWNLFYDFVLLGLSNYAFFIIRPWQGLGIGQNVILIIFLAILWFELFFVAGYAQAIQRAFRVGINILLVVAIVASIIILLFFAKHTFLYDIFLKDLFAVCSSVLAFLLPTEFGNLARKLRLHFELRKVVNH